MAHFIHSLSFKLNCTSPGSPICQSDDTLHWITRFFFFSLSSTNHRAPSLGTRGSQTSFSVQNFILRPCACRARHFAVGWITRGKHAAHPCKGRNPSTYRPLTCTDTWNHWKETNKLEHPTPVRRSFFFCRAATGRDPCTQEILFFFFSRGGVVFIARLSVCSRSCPDFLSGCRDVPRECAYNCQWTVCLKTLKRLLNVLVRCTLRGPQPFQYF